MELSGDFLDDNTRSNDNRDSYRSGSDKRYNNHTNGNNSYNKGGYDKNKYPPKKKSNIIGDNRLNLWDKAEITPREIDSNKFKSDDKFVTISLPNKTYRVTDDELVRFKRVLSVLSDKGYKARFICNNVKDIYSIIVDIMGIENCMLVTPWKTFCKDMNKDLTMYMPSDDNIEAGAHHFKNYHNFHAALKYVAAGIITTLFGVDNNEPSNIIITCDPFYDGKKIDFEKSRDMGNYYLLSRSMSMDIYDLSDNDTFVDLMKLID